MLSRVTSIVLVTLLCVALMTEAAVNRKRRAIGWNQVALTDPEVLAVAAKATQHIEKARNSKVYRLQDVVFAMYQIVEQKHFELTIRIGQTNCLRRAKVDIKNCSIVEVERCAVTVNVWQGKAEIRKFSCEKEKVESAASDGGGAKGVLGEEVDIDVEREDVQEAAIFAAAEMTRQQAGRHDIELKRVTKATSQVVAGTLYRMTMEVDITEIDEVETNTDTCTVKVLDQAWLTPRYTLEQFGCNVFE